MLYKVPVRAKCLLRAQKSWINEQPSRVSKIRHLLSVFSRSCWNKKEVRFCCAPFGMSICAWSPGLWFKSLCTSTHESLGSVRVLGQRQLCPHKRLPKDQKSNIKNNEKRNIKVLSSPLMFDLMVKNQKYFHLGVQETFVLLSPKIQPKNQLKMNTGNGSHETFVLRKGGGTSQLGGTKVFSQAPSAGTKQNPVLPAVQNPELQICVANPCTSPDQNLFFLGSLP